MPHSFVNLNYHIIFGTKYHQPLIAESQKGRLYAYLGGIVRGRGGVPIIVNGTADHVHLLVKLRPDEALSVLLRELKADSTGWMKRSFDNQQGFGWHSGYKAFSVSESEIDSVKQYILDQEERHRTQSFKEELEMLLEEHGVEFDERDL
jgi:REP element-mobilizing transposase RayT